MTTTWSKACGPGTVMFGNINAIDTTTSFSTAGTYVLRLTANDSDLINSDEVTITVNSGAIIKDIRTALSSADAEEKALGSMILTSTDLDLVFEKDNQKVGMRFNEVDIPQNATIINAYIQFKMNEPTSGLRDNFIDHSG